MKHMFTVLLALSAVVAVHAQSSLALGSSLPMANEKLKDISGKDVSMKDAMQEKGLLVMFSCNTCPYVIRNQARTKQLTAFAKQNHIGVMLLNSNEADRNDGNSLADMQSYAKSQGYDFYYAVDADSKVADAFGASRTPEVYLFDAKGILQYKGAIDDNPADADNVTRIHAKEAIAEMTNGKTVSVKESRSIGCAIKRM